MSILSRLFGSVKADTAATAKVEEYKGYKITPQPTKEAQGYRVCAVIEGTVNGEAKSHMLVRADTINDFDDAVTVSSNKARQMIDEQGDRLFI